MSTRRERGADGCADLVLVLPDAEQVCREARERFAGEARSAARERGTFRVALSGGSTPRRLYELLAELPAGEAPPAVPWSKVHFFWGDERLVPPDHEASNYRMAREALLSRLELAPEQVHRVPTELEPERCAQAYEQTLLRAFEGHVRFDLLLLGIGADGHTASLFPGSPALEERERLVAAVRAPGGGPDRVTLTLPAFETARCGFFLASGAEKAEAVRAALGGGDSPPPAGRVRLREGRLVWLLDRAAASRLPAPD
ncbi:MAG TPA: 6-phosphogluconolactonase [Planctomycetota bacterium]|nr:6-phosphogluconolactonase [Planctomycetota bacterium]